MLLLHGVVAAANADAARARLERTPTVAPGAPLVVLVSGRLALIATDASALGLDPSTAEAKFRDPDAAAALALAHTRILTDLAAELDVAPARLGAAAADARALAASLNGRRRALMAVLKRVAGAAEYAVQLIDAAPAAAPAPPAQPAQGAKPLSGRAYLKAKLDRRRGVDAARQQRDALAKQIGEAAGQLAQECLTRAPQQTTDAPPRRLDLALLVARGRVHALAELAACFGPAAEAAGMTLRVVGPWAPFSFLDAPGSSAPPPPAGEKARSSRRPSTKAA